MQSTPKMLFPSIASHVRNAFRISVALCFAAAISLRGEPAAPPALQSLVDRAAKTTLEKFRDQKLLESQFAFTLVDLRDPANISRASFRGAEPIYPASVIKLFYLAAAHRWLEDGRLADAPELRRALADMIIV